jgi:hypothetical protein
MNLVALKGVVMNNKFPRINKNDIFKITYFKHDLAVAKPKLTWLSKSL